VSKAKQKGTSGENQILDLLSEWGHGDAHRTSANTESHDIWLGDLDIPIEVKFRKRWTLFPWISRIRKVASNNQWAIFAIHGDRRSQVGKSVGTVAIFDASFAAELLMIWRHQNEKDQYK
jgi:hypothetical protein|tara:strand:+ start:7751 stop:8110 length:360 start_codon:yes stop_codon:yes gene_type:complete